MRSSKEKSSNFVFLTAVSIALIIVLIGVIRPDVLTSAASAMFVFVEEKFAWLYLMAMLFFVFFCLGIAFGPYGKVRLGSDDARPEYSNVSWFAMLFCAGMGVGLVFYGVTEPLSHYVSPMEGIEPGTLEAARFSIRASFMHWGVHPWSAYALVGLGLAYSQFRKNRPGLISGLFAPLLGEKASESRIGKIIDIFSIIVSVTGVATTLGMACIQICGGMEYLFGLPNNARVWLVVIVVICCIYLLSATTGLDKGIRFLSNCNLYLALALLVMAFLVGPTGDILNAFVSGFGDYLDCFFADSLHLPPFQSNTWIMDWRIFYWAWWISWAPFVGIFVARISKGRTIKEFIIGAILVPSVASTIWFSVFGGVGLSAAKDFTLEALQSIVAVPETAIFIIFEKLPFGGIMSVIALILLIIFFITSADSATFVLSMMTTNGNLNPPNTRKIIWGIIQAAMAYVLLLSGGLKALQTATIAAACPFVIIMLAACWSIIKDLRRSESVRKQEK
ncbi:MAG: BCCT family transporter [Lachnospiraceae bacterium]|nr:BCCT family transporter [Lachnospiraceae bacterium]